MLFQFSVPLYYCGGKRWQGYGFSNFDCTFLKLLCLYLFPRLSGTTHSFPCVDNLDWSKVPKESTAISVIEVPMVTGTLS